MEKHPELLNEGVVRKNGDITPFSAHDALAAVCEMYPGAVPRSHRARLGKAAKELLEDGFEPNIVCAAMLWALKLARPHLVSSLALEMQSAQHGVLGTFPEYRSYLSRLNRESSPQLSRIHGALAEAFQK